MSGNRHDAIDVTTTPFERLLSRAVMSALPLVPRTVTPNQVTVASGLAGALGGLFYVLADGGRAWLLAALGAILFHLVLDVLDGCIARARDMRSDLGYFLDQFLDLMAFVALVVGIGLSHHARFEVVILAALLYAINLTIILHSIHLCGRWVFPMLGPSETLAFIFALTLATYFLPGPVLAVYGMGLSVIDIGFILGLLFGAAETAGMAVRLIAQLARPRP